jgi:hypothetical protein
MNASQQIDKQIAELSDWRGRMMVRLRKVIHDAEPKLKQEFKAHRRLERQRQRLRAWGFQGSHQD